MLHGFRWQNDPLCKGAPYPKVYDEFKKTLSNIRKAKYGKSPTNGEEILLEFENEFIQKEYGFSLLQEHGDFLNDVVITDDFEYCIFSSAKSIALVLENIPVSQRFFILDGTFRITAKGVWEQTLILHINYGLKVSSNSFLFQLCTI